MTVETPRLPEISGGRLREREVKLASRDTSKLIWVLTPKDAPKEFKQGQYIVVDPEIKPSIEDGAILIRRDNALKIISNETLNHKTDTLIGRVVGKFEAVD